MFVDRQSLESHQAERLRALIRTILPHNPFYARKLAGVRCDDLQSLADLAALPFTTKAELVEDQKAHPPYGAALTYPLARFTRLHQTSGTSTGQALRWLDTPESWDWMLHCKEQIFRLVRLRSDDRLFFPFSFGPFLGFWAAFEAATRRGHFVVPGGGMTSLARLRLLVDNAVTVVFCTPSYALHLAEVAAKEGIDLARGPVRMLIVAGEPGGSIAATRQRIESAWGARTIDHSGMTEIGPTAVECWEQPGGMHLLEGDYIAEVIDPQTAKPLPRGAAGELVLTNLGRLGSPLIRYRTGDLVQFDPAPCPCGCPFARLGGGILGRIDDMIHIRGNNVYPSAIEEAVRRFSDVAEYRVVIRSHDSQITLRIDLEPAPGSDGAALVDRVGRALRDELLLRAEVVAMPPGSLPRFEMKARRVLREG